MTHAPVGHWLSLVHQHCAFPVLHVPVAQVDGGAAVYVSAAGSTQPRSSVVPAPVQPAPTQTHLLPGQSVSAPQWHWGVAPVVHVAAPPKEHVFFWLHVGAEVAQPCASAAPVPVQLNPEHPGLVLMHAPVGHWLSLAHRHWLVPVLQVPPAGQVGRPMAVMAGRAGVGITQPRSSVAPEPVHPAPAQTHLLPGQSESAPHLQLPALQAVLPTSGQVDPLTRHVGAVVAQWLESIAAPEAPLQLVPLHPAQLTQTPLVHWLSLVQ